MRRASGAYHTLFLCLVASGLVLDLGTKWLAFTFVGEPQERGSNRSQRVWPGVFSITTSFNKGALWGIGKDVRHANAVFAGLSVLAAGAILYWVFVHGAARDRMLTVALGLILAGTLGNCYDRIVWGKVRDFLYFELINWPIFNLADTWLVCGAFILMVQAFFAELVSGKTAAPANSAVAATAEGGGQVGDQVIGHR